VDALGTLLIYAVLIGLALWALILRPMRRQKAQRVLVTERLQPGVRVMLTSGLLGTVVEVENGELVLDVGGGVHLRYVSRAVATIVDDPASGNSAPSPDVTDGET
jgi:preprotein translocase subunit YajC